MMASERKFIDSSVEWVGKVPEEWTIARLKEVATISSGGTPEKKEEYYNGNVLWATTTDLNNGTLHNTKQSITTLGLESSSAKILPISTVMLAMYGASVGKIAKTGLPMAINQSIAGIAGRQGKVINDFLFYFMSSSKDYLVGIAIGAGQPNISQGLLLEQKITIPPFPEQQAIASYLDHHTSLIDRERDLITQKIALLRDKRKALIYEVVTGKRTIVDAQSLAGDAGERLSDVVFAGNWAAVPTAKADDPFVKSGRLVDSGEGWLGDIPKGWAIHKATHVFVEVKNKNKGLRETNLLSLSYGNVKRRDINSSDGLLPENFEGYNIVEKGNIVLRLTDLQNDQKSIRVGQVTERGIITSAYTSINTIKDDARYMTYLLKAADSEKVFYGIGGGVRQSMKFSDLKDVMVVRPSIEDQQIIVDFLSHATKIIGLEISLFERKSELLSDKRKALIFEAVTGKIDLRDTITP